MQKKLKGLCAFAIFVLLFGWAITPAHAHCKGNHTGDHPHCDGTDGTGSTDGGKIPVTVSIDGLCLDTAEDGCNDDNNDGYDDYVIEADVWGSKDQSVKSTISHGVLSLDIGVPDLSAGFLVQYDSGLLGAAFSSGGCNQDYNFADTSPTRGVIGTDGDSLLQLSEGVEGTVNVEILVWNYHDDGSSQPVQIRQGFKWVGVPITVNGSVGSRVWVIDTGGNPSATLSLGSHLGTFICGTVDAYITITVIEE